MSSDSSPPPTFDGALRNLRIIHVGLLVGVLLFLGYAISQKGALPLEEKALTNLSYTMIGAAVVFLAASYLVPPSMQASVRLQAGRLYAQNPQAEPGEDAFWLSRFTPIFFIRAALLEGGAMMLILNYLMEGLPLAYWASWLFVAAMLLNFPTRGGLRNWIDTQRELVKQERS